MLQSTIPRPNTAPIRMMSWFAIACLLIVSLAAGAEAEWKLDSLRKIYQGKLDQLDTEHDKTVATLLAKYRNALGGLQERSQKEGDLRGVLETRKELERLESQKTPPAGDALASHAKLRDIQAICAKAADKEELSTSRKIVALAAEFTGHLDEEKKRLTIAGDFDGAKAYADEIRRIAGREKEQAAARLVKAAGGPGAVATGSPAAIAAKGTTGCKIHIGPNPPSIDGVEMKQTSLLGTRLGGRISQVAVEALIGARDKTEEQRRRSDYSRTKIESGEIDTLLRLTLRTQGRNKVIQEPLVLVQYFATELAARGIVKPQHIDTEPVRLTALTDEGITIDFPAITLRKHESRYRADYSGTSVSKSGREFHGLMITIFNKDYEIIHQTVTHNSLQDSGELAVAEARTAESKIDLNTARRAYELARDAYYAADSEDPKRSDLYRVYEEKRIRYFALRKRAGE